MWSEKWGKGKMAEKTNIDMTLFISQIIGGPVA